MISVFPYLHHLRLLYFIVIVIIMHYLYCSSKAFFFTVVLTGREDEVKPGKDQHRLLPQRVPPGNRPAFGNIADELPPNTSNVPDSHVTANNACNLDVPHATKTSKAAVDVLNLPPAWITSADESDWFSAVKSNDNPFLPGMLDKKKESVQVYTVLGKRTRKSKNRNQIKMIFL